MISLIKLLEEIQNKPHCIFIAGPAGSGKSTIIKKLIPPNISTIINIDDTYEELLKKSGIGMGQKDFSPEKLSQAAKLLAQAKDITKQKYSDLSKNLKNIIIDGTGAATKPLLKKKQELEDLGYKTFMIALFVSPLTSLERNKNRERSLLPSIVLRTWRDYTKNIDIYKDEFGSNFILINNDSEDSDIRFSKDLIKPYLQNSTAVGKPKSKEEENKSKAEKMAINKDIENLMDYTQEFNSIENAKTKINNFIK